MLDRLFSRFHQRYAASPFSVQLRLFSEWLVSKGYGRDAAQDHVRRLKQVLEWAGWPPESTAFAPEALEQLFAVERDPVMFRATRNAFGRCLAEHGLLHIEPDGCPWANLLDAYREHLVVLRGLAPTTVAQHLATVRALLEDALGSDAAADRLSAEAIERFVIVTGQRLTRQSMQHCVARLRAFLRFCYDRGIVPRRLDAIDTPRAYRVELPPRALPWKTVQKFLRSIDRTSIAGWRDYTILHLMAHYGLRPSEIVALTFASIDWQAKTLRVEQRKTRSALILPLADVSLRIIKRYLHHGRPGNDRPELFLRARGPAGPLGRTAITDLYANRVARSGLPISNTSSYCLRHSFAMRLLTRGVGVKAIGDLLGHRSLESTSVYLRLNTGALRDVALPLPRVSRTVS